MAVIGIENEYGITIAGRSADELDPIALSAAIVTAGTDLAARWDFSTESPLRDARGGHLPRELATPAMLTDEFRYANRLLTNGARFYVDHAHPEYSGPEVTSARDAAIWDTAGDRIVQKAAERVSEDLGAQVVVFKNTTDNKGRSYGCHENHLVARSVPFDDIVGQFTGYLASRSVICGAGRVGLGQAGERPGFQISQRADFFEARVGLETTTRRPLINTRDEPHADKRYWRRLHVITGDALISPVATQVKVGSASLVLDAIARGACNVPQLVDPVAAFHAFSHDQSSTITQPCVDGVDRTAIELQHLYLAAASEPSNEAIDDAAEVLQLWASLLEDASEDPALLADRVDWAAKLLLLEGLRTRGSLEWSDARLAAIDLLWSDLNPSKGLGLKLITQGAMTGLDNTLVEHAIEQPPTATRAWFRGQVLQHWPEAVVQASWDQLIFELNGGRIVTIVLNDPLAATKQHLGAIIEGSSSSDELITRLRHAGLRLDGVTREQGSTP